MSPNADDKLETAFSANKMFSWNMFEKGKQSVSSAKLAYSDTGVLTQSQMLGLRETEHSRVIDTDYTDYAVVYHCSTDHNVGSFLDGKQQQIQIFTRSGTLDAATELTITSFLTTNMSEFDQSRLETIATTECNELSYWSQIDQMLTDPDTYYN